MSFGPCPTVKVRSDTAPDGYVVINAADLTEAHELFAVRKGARPPKSTPSLKPKG